MRRINPLKRTFMTTGLMLLMGNAAMGTQLASESFDYSGTTLTGNNGGTGFSGAYASSTPALNSANASNATNVQPVDLSGDAASLMFPGITSIGARLSDSIGESPTLPDASNRTFLTASRANFSIAATYYSSFLAQRDATGAFKVSFDNSSGSERWRIGVTSTGQLAGGAATSDTSVTTAADFVPAGETVLIVSKYVADGSGHDTFAVKMFRASDTIPSSDASLTYDLTATGTSKVNESNLDFTVSNGSAQIDEFRLGTSWTDVVPTPEPGTFSLLAPAMFGLLRRRKRSTACSKGGILS